jgi:uncharacterized peroxidase-related enzyme
MDTSKPSKARDHGGSSSGENGCREVLDRVRSINNGTVPNLHRVLSRSPAVLKGYVELRGALNDGNLTPAERELVALEVAIRTDCTYCLQAHRKAAQEAGVDPASLDAQVAGNLPHDERLALVVRAARDLLETQGHLPRHRIAVYADLGLAMDALLEIVGVIGAFTLATMVNNMARTRIDPEYRPE